MFANKLKLPENSSLDYTLDYTWGEATCVHFGIDSLYRNEQLYK